MDWNNTCRWMDGWFWDGYVDGNFTLNGLQPFQQKVYNTNMYVYFWCLSLRNKRFREDLTLLLHFRVIRILFYNVCHRTQEYTNIIVEGAAADLKNKTGTCSSMLTSQKICITVLGHRPGDLQCTWKDANTADFLPGANHSYNHCLIH